MVSVKRESIIKAGVASLAIAVVALAFAQVAKAQTMGEYGLAVGHSAGAAAAAPHADLPAMPGTSTQSSSSGSTTTTEIREDDSSPQDAKAADADNSRSSDEWSEVKGSSDDGN